MSEGTIREINIEAKPYGTITGWVGLMKEGSQKGFYGLHTFRNKRLIIPFNKIGFSAHPTVARIYGELHLDFVPVTHNKKSFEKESDEYKLAEYLLETELKDLKLEARKKKSEEMQTSLVKEQTEVMGVKASQAIKQVVEKFDDNKINKQLPKENIVKTYIDDIIDEVSLNSQTDDLVKIENDTKNIGKVLHIDFTGQNLSFTHKFDSLGSEKGPKSWSYLADKKLIIITTNSDFPTYYACKDLPFLALINISESLTEFLLNGKQNENSLGDYKRIFNMIMRIASEKKEELE